MTIMSQKLEFKQNWSRPKMPKGKEAIHSGHFMVSDFEAEAQDDEDELAVPVPEDNSQQAVVPASRSVPQCIVTVPINSVKLSCNQLSIETSLTKLFQCMSLAYRQKLTSPKWNRFKGIRLRWKDKIRLNNVIWRCWHMQFINKQNTLVCQFASPLDADTHNKPEAVVLEGKYWKRKLNAVTAEYKKWRMYSHNQMLGRPPKYGHDMLAEFDGQDWSINSNDSIMMVDEDYMGLMSDTLFSTITANQPYAFPDPREIARGTNLADFIQPSLVQLQPNLDEIMDIEPLHDFLCNKLTTVPEETQALQQSHFTEVKSNLNQTPPTYAPPYPPPYPSQNLWYSLPEYNSAQVQQNIQQQPENYPTQPQSTYPSQQATNTTNISEMILQRKEEVFIQPKIKTKGRSRANGYKKMATAMNNPVALSSMQSPQALQTSNLNLQQDAQQNNALLAQLLTNSSSNNFTFIGNDSPNTSSKVMNLKEEVSYAQTYGSMNNSIGYKSESEFNKPTSYQISSTGNVNPSTSAIQSVQTGGTTSMIIKSIQPPMSNVVCSNSSIKISPESPVQSENLSPLSVGSPTSPTNSNKPVPAYREHRRVCHINAEQKRRCNIKNGFDTLHSLIPQLNQNPNAKMSKAAMLQKGAEYIRHLQNERNQLQQEMDSLKQQIETLNTEICNCQSMLPATGAPISKHRSNKMRDMYRKYVRSRTQDNWKFWILSLICEPLLESFNTNVATSSLDDLYRTTLQWVDQHCTLVDLRPIVLNALRLLCTTTEVLTDPARLPSEARASVEKSSKKQS